MAFARAESQSRSFADINITPLVDVMLVLLIIFMVTAPVMTREIPLSLGGRPPPTPVAVQAPIELRIDGIGNLFFDGQPTTRAGLPALFQGEAARAGDGPLPAVLVKASGDAPYETIARSLASAQNAGFDRIRFDR